MKRSASLSLVVMGAAAFTATFAGGSAFLAWQRPAQPQTCTPRPDGTQACTPNRAASGFARSFHVSLFPDRATTTSPAAVRVADAAASSSAVSDGAARRGFGASAKVAFRGSAGG